MAFLSLVLFFVTLLFAGDKAAAATPDGSKGGNDLTPTQLYHRIYESSTSLQAMTATGGYVSRLYNAITPAKEQKVREDLQQVAQTIKESHENQRRAAKKLGGSVDEERLEKEFKNTMLELETKAKPRAVFTTAERYKFSGQKYRIERIELSDDEPPEILSQKLKSGRLTFTNPSIQVWDGQQTAEINRHNAHGRRLEDTLLLHSTKPMFPDFIHFGRDAHDPDLLSKLNIRGSSLPMSIEAVRSGSGDEALLLSIGAKNTMGLQIQMVTVPSKGYVITSAIGRVSGAVMSSDKYDTFFQTPAGFWIPQHALRETYTPDSAGVPQLNVRHEFVAFEPPQLNVVVDESEFALAARADFRKKLGPVVRESSPTRPLEHLPSRQVTRFYLLVAINVLVVLAIGGFAWWKRRTK